MNVKQLEQYLSDFDNLVETGTFEDVEIKDKVFYHKEMKLKQFLAKGREIIRLTTMFKKGINAKVVNIENNTGDINL